MKHRETGSDLLCAGSVSAFDDVIIYGLSGSNSLVECDLAKVEVAGSNPVSRSRFPPPAAHFRGMDISGRQSLRYGQGRGTQVVRERSAKPLCVGSIPTRASNVFLHIPSD